MGAGNKRGRIFSTAVTFIAERREKGIDQRSDENLQTYIHMLGIYEPVPSKN